MPEPFFFAVTRTPSIAPPSPVTCPESPGSALAATAPRLAATSATPRLAAVDNNTCFIRIMITPWYVFSGERPKHSDLILRSAASLRRVSKDGRVLGRACGHPSRRAHRNRLLPISTLFDCRSRAGPTSVRAPQDEVRICFTLFSSVHLLASCVVKYFRSGGR